MKRGDQVAEFELPDEKGTVRSLTELLADGPIVLFFYPAAMSPGCTKEACHFRDLASEFAAVGASRVGISTDAVEKQAKFAEKQELRLPAAVGRRRHRRHAVRRQARAARQVHAGQADDVRHRQPTAPCSSVIASEVSMDTHADKALEVLRQRQSA